MLTRGGIAIVEADRTVAAHVHLMPLQTLSITCMHANNRLLGRLIRLCMPMDWLQGSTLGPGFTSLKVAFTGEGSGPSREAYFVPGL